MSTTTAPILNRIDTERQGTLENEVKVRRGYSAEVTVTDVIVVPVTGGGGALLLLGWRHGSLLTPISHDECIRLAQMFLHAAEAGR